jgi:alcohol dehydrogenase
MKTAQLVNYGTTDSIHISETPQPKVEAGNVRIKVRSAGVNPFDWKLRNGVYQKTMSLTLPFTMGGDFAGTIDEVGDDIKDFAKGDYVYGQGSILAGGTGSFAEFVTTNPQNIALMPKNITPEEAGSLPLVGSSAIQALIDHMDLKKGQRIFIHGGAGGIGTIAIQIAKHIGAYVGTTASTNDLSYVKDLGADEVIDYTKEKFENMAKDFDAVFDTIGGETYTRSFSILKKGGIIVSMLEQPNEALMKQYNVQAIAQQTKITNEHLTKLAELVDNNSVTVHIDTAFPLEQTNDALTYLQEKHPKGKVVINVS